MGGSVGKVVGAVVNPIGAVTGAIADKVAPGSSAIVNPIGTGINAALGGGGMMTGVGSALRQSVQPGQQPATNYGPQFSPNPAWVRAMGGWNGPQYGGGWGRGSGSMPVRVPLSASAQGSMTPWSQQIAQAAALRGK